VWACCTGSKGRPPTLSCSMIVDGAMTVPSSHDWQRGASIVSAQAPRLLVYPHFLSDDEVDHLLRACREHEDLNSVESGRTVSVDGLLPEDPVVMAIEERCAMVTGIPCHGDEEPLGLRRTAASTEEQCSSGMVPSLHVDTNQGGTYRCATVLMYLHDTLAGDGGETRFPLCFAGADSHLRSCAERVLGCGATHASPDAAIEWPPHAPRRALFEAAEAEGVGYDVRPVRGLACVFWTYTEEGVDPCSWHTGARLRAPASKMIAQKFKALPLAHRTAERLVLPSELQPPSLDDTNRLVRGLDAASEAETGSKAQKASNGNQGPSV